MAADPAARILIAEDNPQGAELLEAYLAETPWEIQVAGNGEEALKMASEWIPDVVLLDVMMPRLSGFEVCRMLRENPATKSVGILMITALDQASDIDRAIDAGTDDFLTKPINKTELLIRIRALLGSRSQSGELVRAFEYIRNVEQSAR
jgi:two-component system, OmpR family, alkaline phosphatase synthesis response regulator PhoP